MWKAGILFGLIAIHSALADESRDCRSLRAEVSQTQQQASQLIHNLKAALDTEKNRIVELYDGANVRGEYVSSMCVSLEQETSRLRELLGRFFSLNQDALVASNRASVELRTHVLGPIDQIMTRQNHCRINERRMYEWSMGVSRKITDLRVAMLENAQLLDLYLRTFACEPIHFENELQESLIWAVAWNDETLGGFEEPSIE